MYHSLLDPFFFNLHSTLRESNHIRRVVQETTPTENLRGAAPRNRNRAHILLLPLLFPLTHSLSRQSSVFSTLVQCPIQLSSNLFSHVEITRQSVSRRNLAFVTISAVNGVGPLFPTPERASNRDKDKA